VHPAGAIQVGLGKLIPKLCWQSDVYYLEFNILTVGKFGSRQFDTAPKQLGAQMSHILPPHPLHSYFHCTVGVWVLVFQHGLTGKSSYMKPGSVTHALPPVGDGGKVQIAKFSRDKKLFSFLHGGLLPGLPDFSWHNLPEPGKICIPITHNICRIATKYTKLP
jgi:hypothetical protein